MLKYEATVGGTMPLISLIEKNLVGNEILSIRGSSTAPATTS